MQFYTVKVNTFYPYHIKASVLPFLLHWLQIVLLFDFVDYLSDLLVHLLPMPCPTHCLEVFRFSTLSTFFAIHITLFQHMPSFTVFAIFHTICVLGVLLSSFGILCLTASNPLVSFMLYSAILMHSPPPLSLPISTLTHLWHSQCPL